MGSDGTIQKTGYIVENIDYDLLEILPIDACPTHFVEISIKGLPEAELTIDNDNFSKNMAILGNAYRKIQDEYHEEYIFSEPVMCLLGNGEYQVKIGMMEKHIWEQIKEKRNAPPS